MRENTPVVSFTPTDEQQDIIEAARRGEDLCVQAGAGSGKTATVEHMCRALPGKRILYLVYNAAARREAKQRMPYGVDCQTTHSLAFREIGDAYQHRMRARRLPKQDAPLLGTLEKGVFEKINRDWRDLAEADPEELVELYLRGAQLQPHSGHTRMGSFRAIGLARRAIERFATSDEDRLRLHHVPSYRDRDRWVSKLRHKLIVGADAVGAKLTPADTQAVMAQAQAVFEQTNGQIRKAALPIARALWKHAVDPASELKFTFDMMLKIWAMNQPDLSRRYDVIIVDEAQDSTPLVRKLVLDQEGVQKIAVGDSMQSLYGWRGAHDILLDWPGTELQLTGSFRFGPEIAAVGNLFLDQAGSNLRLRGLGGPGLVGSGLSGTPSAVLCRTNGQVVREVADLVKNNVPTGVAGGVGPLRRLIEGVHELITEGRSTHPDLREFESFEELETYAHSEDGRDMRTMVKLVTEHGCSDLVQLLSKVVDEDKARTVVSTMHKSKGLQWPHVKIAEGDDGPLTPKGEPDLMLYYVAVTRAEESLDVSGLSISR